MEANTETEPENRAEIYKETILRILEESNIPLRTETVRKRAGIPNWLTAKSLCLELALLGKIEATKTSGSWIFASPSNSS